MAGHRWAMGNILISSVWFSMRSKIINNTWQNIVLYARVSRIHVLVMPTLLIACAYLYTRYHYEICSMNSFWFVSLSILLYNLAVNTISEYRDCERGIDDAHSPGTKYRLITGIVPRKHILYIGITAFLLASICGVLALISRPYTLLFPGIIAAFITLFYSEQPFGFKYNALAEICVFVVYSFLIFSSCILSLTRTLCLKDLFFSIPFGLLTTCVVLANNIRDYKFEQGKTTTIPIKYGLKFAYTLLFLMVHLAFLCVPFFVYFNIMPRSGFITLLAYLFIFLSIKKINSPAFINCFGLMQTAFSCLNIVVFL